MEIKITKQVQITLSEDEAQKLFNALHPIIMDTHELKVPNYVYDGVNKLYGELQHIGFKYESGD